MFQMLKRADGRTDPGNSIVVPSYGTGASRVGQDTPFATVLEHAEALLAYAASAGIPVDPAVRHPILTAWRKAGTGTAQEADLTEQEMEALLVAFTALSDAVKPVSGESANKCLRGKEIKKARRYEYVAVVLGVLIALCSYLAYVATAACDATRKDIEAANALTVTLHAQVLSPAPAASSVETNRGAMPPNPDELRNLQTFAALIRDIQIHARRLQKYIPFFRSRANVGRPPNPHSFYQLTVPVEDVVKATTDAIQQYQVARGFAQSVQEEVSVGIGAVASCFLPALYAVLGACAYVARRFESQIKARTFTGNEKPMVRLLIAGICGVVVGLFGNFVAGHGDALPPLAIAFLVGYGTDVFLLFLDGLLQVFGRPAGAGDMPAASRRETPAKGPQSSRAPLGEPVVRPQNAAE